MLKKYQNYYDIIHGDKDYAGETESLIKAIKKYSVFQPINILSLGCGTCGHEVILAGRGYNIKGIDYSKIMLGCASRKAKESNVKISFRLGDIRNFSFSGKFDAVISMYNVLCDISGLPDLEKTFKCVRKALKKNGIFIFDCLYGPAILKNKPEKRVKVINFNGRKFIQKRSSKLDIKHSMTDTLFEVFEILGGDKKKITEKKHKVRFWYFSELEYLLHKTGFKIVKTGDSIDFKKDISENNWDMFFVAQKI